MNDALDPGCSHSSTTEFIERVGERVVRRKVKCNRCGALPRLPPEPNPDLEAALIENARLRERIDRLEQNPREPQAADLDTELYT